MGKTLLVTGGCGFIGTNFVLRAVQDGFDVVTLDIQGYAAAPLSVARLNDLPGHRLIKGSIGDRALVGQLLRQFRPQAVVNFAAHSHVDRSIDDPSPFIDTNIVGTFHLLEAIRAYVGEGDAAGFRLLHVSTDEVFGSIDQGEFGEGAPQRPSSPYSASKAAADNLATAWHVTYGLPVIVTHCTNNYGPFQFPEKLIPHLLIRALSGQTLTVYGDGLHSRDWLHVADHVACLLRILDAGQPGETYNIAGRAVVANIELVHRLCASLDRHRPRLDGQPHAEAIRFVADRPGHDRRYALDCGKAERELGWSPSVCLKDGLDATVQWYLENSDWWEAILRGSYRAERQGLPAITHS